MAIIILINACQWDAAFHQTVRNFLNFSAMGRENKVWKKYIDHYLDDFILMGAKNTENCSFLMSTFENVCDELGVPIAANKTIGPTPLLPF